MPSDGKKSGDCAVGCLKLVHSYINLKYLKNEIAVSLLH